MGATVIVDCLSLWVANLLEQGREPDDDLARLASERDGLTIAVSNEVGLGIVPANELARRYRDVLGRVNAAWVAASDEAFLCVAGRAIALMSLADRVQARLDAKTKPRGSLGRLEELAVRIASIVGEESPGRLEAAVVVAAGDHGVADEGVSAYPQEVTRQMVANFESGGAAVSVLARQAGARVVVVDAGVGNPTGNIAVGPALTRDEAGELVAPRSRATRRGCGRTVCASSCPARWESPTRPSQRRSRQP